MWYIMFIISFIIAFLLVYLSKKDYIIAFPNINNINKINYKDDVGKLYKYEVVLV